MAANHSPSQPVQPASTEQIFRAFYAKAVRAAELARRTGAGTGKWPYYRPHPANHGPLGSSR
jgi:hypothetical protein